MTLSKTFIQILSEHVKIKFMRIKKAQRFELFQKNYFSITDSRKKALNPHER